MSSPIEVYDSSRQGNPLVEEFIFLVKYRDLVWQFVSTSIKIRYKRSFLGVVWTLLNPLLMMIVLTLVFSAIFRFQIEYYSVYVLSGLIAWNFFSSTTNGSMQNMVLSGSLLNRIYVPKSVFAVSALGTGLVNLGLSLIPLFLISLVLGLTIRPAALAMPVAIFLLGLFALGVSLILQTAAVYFADMIPVYEVLLTIWFYATPIIYPVEAIPEGWSWIFRLNPLYYLVAIFREPLFSGTLPEPLTWAIAGLVAGLAFLLGGIVFTLKAHEYAYRI